MYSASQREVGEYNDRMLLEVGTKLFNNYLERQCHLLETGISGFCLGQRLAYKKYRPVLPMFIFFE